MLTVTNPANGRVIAELAEHTPDAVASAYLAARAAYNRASYSDERRRLANWYADELARLEAGAAAKVVSIKSAA